MGYLVSDWYGDPRDQGDGVKFGTNYSGKMFIAKSSATPTEGRYWEFVRDNPDRFAFTWINQRLLSWLQSLGPDSARVYYSVANWPDGNYTYTSFQGTIFELLGEDYLSGARSADYTQDASRWRTACFMRCYYREIDWGHIQGFLARDWLDTNPTSLNSLSGTYYWRLQELARYYDLNYYWDHMGAFQDYRVVQDDTPGNEYFMLFTRYNKFYQEYRGTGHLYSSIYDPDQYNYTDLGNTEFCVPTDPKVAADPAEWRGRKFLGEGYYADNTWVPLVGYGRIQNIQTYPDTEGQDAGWYMMSPTLADTAFNGVGSYSNQLPTFVPLLETPISPSMFRYQSNSRTRDNSLLLQEEGYVSENTNRPDYFDRYPLGHPYLAKYSQQPYGYSTIDNALPLSTPFQRGFGQGSAAQPVFMGAYRVRRMPQRYYHKMPVYNYINRPMGHTTANMIFTNGRTGDEQFHLSDRFISAEHDKFVLNNQVWQHTGQFAFKTDEVAP